MNADISIELGDCIFASFVEVCLFKKITCGEIIESEHAYKLSRVFSLNMPNLFTMRPFLAEVSTIVFNGYLHSAIYANDVFQHGPQNQHIPKP